MSEEIRTTSSSGGQKGTKAERFDLIPPEALAELARIYEMGSRKYKDHNYRLGYEWSKSYASLQRHANQWWAGEDTDEESGLSHIMHAAWHCFALYIFLLEHPEFDDRLSTVRKKQPGLDLTPLVEMGKMKDPRLVALEQKNAELEARIWELENPNTPSETGEEVVYDRPDQRKEKIVKYGVPDKFYPSLTEPVIQDGKDICCHNCKFSCIPARKDSE